MINPKPCPEHARQLVLAVMIVIGGAVTIHIAPAIIGFEAGFAIAKIFDPVDQI